MRYLLDTCVLSELVKKTPSKRVVNWVRDQEETRLFVSVLTFGELEKGVGKLVDGRRKRAQDAGAGSSQNLR